MAIQIEVDQNDNITVDRNAFATILQSAFDDGNSYTGTDGHTFGERITTKLFNQIEHDENMRIAEMKKKISYAKKKLKRINRMINRIMADA